MPALDTPAAITKLAKAGASARGADARGAHRGGDPGEHARAAEARPPATAERFRGDVERGSARLRRRGD